MNEKEKPAHGGNRERATETAAFGRAAISCSYSTTAAADRQSGFIASLLPYQEEDRCILMPECKGEQEVTLSCKANGYGESQTFFLCPICGARVRFLYFNGRGRLFKCRKCSWLNYQSQQETRSGTMFYYDKGMDFVEKHLDRWPRLRPDGFAFCD